jgi:CDP-diacylglycerol--glycerol-3-phosphate 3-phosphatidyltransferase
MHLLQDRSQTDQGITSPLTRLRRQWALAALLAIGLVLGGFTLLRGVWGSALAGRWALGAVAGQAWVMGALWRGLSDNHRRGEEALLPTLGAGNLATTLRGMLIGLLAGFLLVPRPTTGASAWAPGALYTLAVLVDYIDGFLARATDHTTALGERLDTNFDALGILIAPLLGVLYGQLPIWYLLVSAARYLFVFGSWWLKRQGQTLYNLDDNPTRRAMAGLQMVVISVALWPLFSPPATTIAATLLMIPFIGGFVRDWLVVSGRIDPALASYQTLTKPIHKAVTHWLPVPLRVLVIAVAVIEMVRLNWWAVGVLAVMVALGAAGRTAALALLVLTALAVTASGLTPTRIALMGSTIALMFTGSGVLSLWQPEDAFLRWRAGE